MATQVKNVHVEYKQGNNLMVYASPEILKHIKQQNYVDVPIDVGRGLLFHVSPLYDINEVVNEIEAMGKDNQNQPQ